MTATAYVQQYALSTTDTLTWNTKVYYPVTEWEISTTSLGTATNIKAAIRFMMREDSEVGSNYIIAQYSAYTTNGNKRAGDASYMERRIGGAVTSSHSSPSVTAGDVMEGSMAQAIRVNRTWNSSVVTGGHFIDVNYPYMIYNCSSDGALGANVSITNVPAFYVGDSNDYNTTEPSITSTYTTPGAPVGDYTYNKVVINGQTIMDVSKDTVAAGYMLASASGVSGSISAHDKDGKQIYGTIVTLDSSGLTTTTHGSTVTATAGYYPSDVSKSVDSGTWTIGYSSTPLNVTIGAAQFDIATASVAGSASNITVNIPTPISASITASITTSGYLTTASKTGYVSISGSSSIPVTTLEPSLTAGNIKSGVKLFGVTGTFTNTSSAPAVGEVFEDKVYYANGSVYTGTMHNYGTFGSQYIATSTDVITVSGGYHGAGTVALDPSAIENLVPSRIESGYSILGVNGTLMPSVSAVVASATAKGFVSLDPSASASTFTPSGSINYFNQVTITPILATTAITPSTSGYTLTITASEPTFSATVVS